MTEAPWTHTVRFVPGAPSRHCRDGSYYPSRKTSGLMPIPRLVVPEVPTQGVTPLKGLVILSVAAESSASVRRADRVVDDCCRAKEASVSSRERSSCATRGYKNLFQQHNSLYCVSKIPGKFARSLSGAGCECQEQLEFPPTSQHPPRHRFHGWLSL